MTSFTPSELLVGAGYFLATSYVFWILFLAAMNLIGAYRAGTISPVAKALGYPMIIVGVVLDFLFNMIVLTIIMVELPKELLVTERLARHMWTGTGWRQKFAASFCSKLLDTFDPSGSHCHAPRK
jgi:hypothetical protein